METDSSNSNQRATEGRLQGPRTKDPLIRLEMTFSPAGYGALRVYREFLAQHRGRNIPLGVALDELIETHQFCARRPAARGEQA